MEEKKNNVLILTVVLDETGSMEPVRQKTIDGFNEYMNSIRKKEDNVFVTLTKFNSGKMQIMYDALPISKVPSLTTETYNPNNGTPLFDAVGNSIKKTEDLLAKQLVKPSVLMVIITDGEENASTEYKLQDIKKMIDERQESNSKWTFAFLGADVASWQQGQNMGIAINSTMKFDVNSIDRTFCTMGSYTGYFLARGAVSTSNFFTNEALKAQ